MQETKNSTHPTNKQTKRWQHYRYPQPALSKAPPTTTDRRDATVRAAELAPHGALKLYDWNTQISLEYTKYIKYTKYTNIQKMQTFQNMNYTIYK